MTFPYQCLVARESTETGPGGWTLFGACGSTLIAQSSSGGTSTWTKPDEPVPVSDTRLCCRGCSISGMLDQADASRHPSLKRKKQKDRRRRKSS